MNRAKTYFHQQGFTSVEDVSRRKPFDLHVKDGRRELFVEVKGTQSAGARILLTRGEVEFARRHKDKMALFIIHSMRFHEGQGEVLIQGGSERVLCPWDVDDGDLTPVSFSYAIP